MAINMYISMITLDVNGLNATIKRHRVADSVRKHDPHICCLKGTHLTTKHSQGLNVKRWGKRNLPSNQKENTN